MEKLVVKGGNRLTGSVKTSGAKNAVLPIIAASILGNTPSRLEEIPALDDVRTICAVLNCLGIKVDASEPHVLNIDSTEITSCEAPYELVRCMRASFLSWVHCWLVKERRVFRSLVAVRLVHVRLILQFKRF